LNNFNRVVILSSAVGTALIGLLLQQLLSLGIRKPEQKFDSILPRHIVKFVQNVFSNVTVFKAKAKNQPPSREICGQWSKEYLPRKPDFLAHAGLVISTDLLRHYTKGLKMASQILDSCVSIQTNNRGLRTYRFGPCDRNIGAVDVGRAPILEVLETRVA
jgi:hypothetical protein